MKLNNIPKIALGAWAWGSDGTFGDTYETSHLREVFATAMKNGLNLWDTALVYGMGASEKILGELCRDIAREDVIISTKFTPQLEDGTPDAMKNMFEISCANLGTDVIDIYWIHNPMDVEKYTPMLAALAKNGKIRSIGVSNHNLSEIKRANEILGAAGLRIDAVQNHFSLLNRSSEKSGILAYCEQNDIDFYSYMVLEQGALCGRYDADHLIPSGSDRAKVYNPMLPAITPLIEKLRSLAAKYNCGAAQIATAWALAKKTIPIVGVTKPAQVEDALCASKITLDSADIAALESVADDSGVSTIRYWEKEME